MSGESSVPARKTVVASVVVIHASFICRSESNTGKYELEFFYKVVLECSCKCRQERGMKWNVYRYI